MQIYFHEIPEEVIDKLVIYIIQLLAFHFFPLVLYSIDLGKLIFMLLVYLLFFYRSRKEMFFM